MELETLCEVISNDLKLQGNRTLDTLSLLNLLIAAQYKLDSEDERLASAMQRERNMDDDIH